MSTRNIVIVVAILAVLAVGAWALGWFATDTAMEPAAPGAPATTQAPPPAEPAPAPGGTATEATPPQPGVTADPPVRADEPATADDDAAMVEDDDAATTPGTAPAQQ